MHRDTTVQDLASPLRTIPAAPTPLDLPIGSAIVIYSGEVWITQEGQQDDFVLGPGQRFDVRSRAPIVASAIIGRNAIVYIVPAPATFETDIHELLRLRALQLRTEEINRVARALRDRLSNGLTRIADHIRTMLETSITRPPIRRQARH